ncbi:MAG: hypothetical protein L6R41_001892 [Letrouitia leprolyta]|nr:MAG: hypothetical protein L6R41_001892 [Letrouitia leprolyta]
MDDHPLHFPSTLSLGYAGIHLTMFTALHYLANLRPASEVAEEDRFCFICNEPPSVRTGHDLVQLDCGHSFGRSCLLFWLTPLENEGNRIVVPSDDHRVRARVEYVRTEEENEREETEDEHNEEEGDNGLDNTWSRAGQTIAGLLEVRSRLTSPWTPVNRRPNFSRPSSIRDGGEVANESLEDFQESSELPPRRRMGIRDSEHTDPSLRPAEQPYLTQPANSPIDPVRSPPSPEPLTQTPLQEIPKVEDFGGVLIRRLFPGNNTCPLCRTTVFPKPVHGESLHRIRLCIRVWDLAYKYACIQRNHLEDDFRLAGLAYGQMWESTRVKGDSYVEFGLRLEQRHIFGFAARTLIAINEQREVFFGRQWTNQQRQALETFGRYMKFREADTPVWFSTCESLEDVRMIHVWLGPDRRRRLTRRSDSNWIQVRIKDHPNNFRLGSDDEDVESEEDVEGVEDEENEDEHGAGREHRMDVVDMTEEDGDDMLTEDLLGDRSSVASEESDNLEESEQGDDDAMADDALDIILPNAGNEFENLEQSEGGSSDDLSTMDPQEYQQLEDLYGECSDDFSSMASDELEQLGRDLSYADPAMNNAADEIESESPDEEDNVMDVSYEP